MKAHTKLVEEAVSKAKEAAKTAKAEIDIQRKKRRLLEEKLHDTEEEKNRKRRLRGANCAPRRRHSNLWRMEQIPWCTSTR